MCKGNIRNSEDEAACINITQAVQPCLWQRAPIRDEVPACVFRAGIPYTPSGICAHSVGDRQTAGSDIPAAQTFSNAMRVLGLNYSPVNL